MVAGQPSAHCKKYLRDSWVCFDQTLLGLGMGNIFSARESLVSDISAGDGNTAKPFFTVYNEKFNLSIHSAKL